jgi:FAD:protein FMN transferase
MTSNGRRDRSRSRLTTRRRAVTCGAALGIAGALCFAGTVLPALADEGAGGSPPAPLLAWEGQTMGTVYSVKIAGVAPDETLTAALRAAVEERFAEINRHMSHYQPDSELSRFNQSTSLAPVKVSADFAHVVRVALELNRESAGAFDPALGRLINLWGFGPAGKARRVPPDADIAAALARCGASHLRVTAQDELQKDIPDLYLNLSASAKGYASDEAARVLRERGYSNVFVSVCGEIVAFGANAEGKPWQVGVEQPGYGDVRGNELSAVVELSGHALSTSGDPHNFFRDEQGRVYSHILDPATGRPVQHNLATVTVIAPNGLMADSAATTLYVLGPERGLRWVEQHADIAALFIVRTDAQHFQLIPSTRFPAFRKLE